MRLPSGGDCADIGEVATTWGKWLHAYSWGWWCHLTFLIPPAQERATKLLMAWIHKLNRKLFGRNYYRYGGTRWVYGMEWQQRGAIHFHVLVAKAERLDIDMAVRAWQALSGGNAEIAVYDHTLGATNYLAKVYTGLPTGEIYLGGRWTGRAAGLVGKVV